MSWDALLILTIVSLYLVRLLILDEEMIHCVVQSMVKHVCVKNIFGTAAAFKYNNSKIMLSLFAMELCDIHYKFEFCSTVYTCKYLSFLSKCDYFF